MGQQVGNGLIERCHQARPGRAEQLLKFASGLSIEFQSGEQRGRQFCARGLDPLAHAGNLCELRLSITTTSAGTSFGQSTRSRQASHISASVAASTLIAARMPRVSIAPRIVSCLVPEFDDGYLSCQAKEAVWARYCTGAPARQRRSVERYSTSQESLRALARRHGVNPKTIVK